MGETLRRAGAALLALVIGGLSVGWGVTHEQTLADAARAKAKTHARDSLARAARAVAELPGPVADQARSFAEFKRLTELLSQTTNDDVAQLVSTLSNADEQEQWLRSWTDVGTLGLAFDGRVVFVSGGRALPDNVKALVSRAQSARVAEVVMVDGAPMLVGLVPSTTRGTQQQVAVAIMLTPLDAPRLASVAQQVGSTVSVLYGEHDVSSGDAVEVTRLKTWLHDGAAEAEPCCAAQALAVEAKLGVYVDPAAQLGEAESAASRDRLVAFLVGGVLSVLTLVFGLRKRAPAASEEHTQLLRETAAELQRSREEMQRLSQRISSSDAATKPAVAAVTDVGLDQTAAAIQVSRYQLVAPLGEGGMARVVVAQVRGAEGFRRLFVVKRLRPELVGNQEIVNQFIDEARLGSSLVHSNIVPVFDFGRDAEGYFLAQEYILGRDVDAVLQSSRQKRGVPLEPAIVLYVAQESLKALAYAHTRHDDAGRALALVHRDVSPNNLLLSARGELKLLDFGIVKSDQRLTKTQTGVVKGNLFFMSPEQARAEEVDVRSDLFSLGLVLFTAATGQTLYTGNSSYELLTRSGAGPTAEDLNRVRALLPGGLGTLITRALQPRREDRYPDAEAFGRALADAGRIASSADVQLLMESLFKDDFAAETNRLARTP